MAHSGAFFIISIIVLSPIVKSELTGSVNQIHDLVKQWAPLIWLTPEEKFFPVGVESFLKNVKVVDEFGDVPQEVVKLRDVFQPSGNSTSLYLVTKTSLDLLKESKNSILQGENPSFNPIPVYVVVQTCTNATDSLKNDVNIALGQAEQSLVFSVTYWTFYPYNKGKEVCFLGNVPTFTLFGTCFGHLKTIGSHVGDWEHVTLFFNGDPFPSEMFLSVHNTGGYYKYDSHHQYFKYNPKRMKKRPGIQKPKFPPTVRMQKGHPVLFSAEGSHGLWAAPGDHDYLKFPRLTDKCAYGVPWKTWDNLVIFELEDSDAPNWLFYKGKWGNPSNNCVFFKKLGLCEHVDGPRGIIRHKQDFNC